jgi:hypothetical protein
LLKVKIKGTRVVNQDKMEVEVRTTVDYQDRAVRTKDKARRRQYPLNDSPL